MKAFKVGHASIVRVEEVLEVGFEPSFLFPGFDPSVLERDPILTSPNFLDAASGRVRSSIHSWLIRLGGKTILVDTCSGNGKSRALPLFQRFHMLDFPYLDNLAAAGVRPEDVDIVFCTHLHIDHVGWNTKADGDKWVPTFPNARYVFGKAELEHWTTGDGPRVFPENVDVIEDSVRPVLDAGMVDLVEPGDEIAPGLRVEAAPGHTITQLILSYDDGEGHAFVCSADCLHQPIQIYAPELSSCFCEAPDEAETTRRRLLSHCADTGALLLPIHFGPPHAGYVVRTGDGYAFQPVDPR